MSTSRPNPLVNARSIMETPVLDERKWAKVPHLPTDAVFIDMEDTVAQARKLEGRAAVAKAFEDLSYFGGRVLISRPNALDTEWGHEDTVTLAKAGAQNVLLPMATCAADVLAYQEIFHKHDNDPLLLVAIETPGAVGHVEEIVAIDQVAGMAFGEGDLTAAMGLPIFLADGSMNPMIPPARSRVYIAAASQGLAMFDVAFTPDLKDTDFFTVRAQELKNMGATGMFALYPPQVDIINTIFAPSEEEVAYARSIVAAFDEAIAKGIPAIQLPNGHAVLIHDYKKAFGMLTRAGLL